MKSQQEKEYCIKRISELNEKNKNQEYSLGNCLLLSRFEKELIDDYGATQSYIVALSPSYYH